MFQQQLAQLITEKHNEIQFIGRCLEVIEELGLQNFSGYCSSWSNRVDIYVNQYELPDKDEIMKNILAKVKRFTKEYNAAAKRIDLVTTYQGIELHFECAPAATCKIEEYDEIETIPAVLAKPETVRVVKRFKFSGDCGPMFAE